MHKFLESRLPQSVLETKRNVLPTPRPSFILLRLREAIETLRRIAGNYTQIDAAHLYDRLPAPEGFQI